jgi:hypothetical protein
MGCSYFRLDYRLNNKTVSTAVCVPDYVIDADADRPLDCPEDEAPLTIYLTGQLPEGAALGYYEPYSPVIGDVFENVDMNLWTVIAARDVWVKLQDRAGSTLRRKVRVFDWDDAPFVIIGSSRHWLQRTALPKEQ